MMGRVRRVWRRVQLIPLMVVIILFADVAFVPTGISTGMREAEANPIVLVGVEALSLALDVAIEEG